MVMNELLRENRRTGIYMQRVAQVRKFRNRYSEEELSEICFITPELLRSILEIIDAHPEWDDEKVAENIDFD